MKNLLIIFLSLAITSFTLQEESPLITTKWYLRCDQNVLPHTSKIIHLYKDKPSGSCANYWDFKVNSTINIIASKNSRGIVYNYPYEFNPKEKQMIVDGEEFRISKINEDEIVLIRKN